MSDAPASARFSPVFERLKAMLRPYGRRMHVTVDGPDAYGVDMAHEDQRDPTTWFGGVCLGKAYVSYYLMPVYVEPALLEGISPGLKRRMQGKSCFNFTRIDEGLFSELAALTEQSIDRQSAVVEAALAASPRRR